MASAGVGSVLVVEGGVLIGILTDRDLAIRLLACGLPPETPVHELMTPDPVTVQGDAELDQVLEIFLDHKVRRLPVLEGDEVAGILSFPEVITESLSDLPLMVF